MGQPADRGAYCSPESEKLIFLDVHPRISVVVRHDHLTGERTDQDWWNGPVIHCDAAARDPAMHHRFQSADLNIGVIR